MRAVLCVLLGFWMQLFWLAVAEAAPSIVAPDKVAIGAAVMVSVEGSTNPRDFVTIVPLDAREGAYEDYAYVTDTAPVKVMAPTVPGDYEVRLCAAASPYATLARRAIRIETVASSVEAPAQIAAGAEFQVRWTGPGNANDYVAIGSASRQYIDYKYTRDGSPITLRAPDQPGSYEVRYFLGQGNTIIARQPISVGAVNASVTLPAQVEAGGKFKVTWTGPNHLRDYLTVVAEGAPDKAWTTYVYTSEGNPLEMTAPDAPGKYEVRYVTGQSNATLSRASFNVTAVTGSLEGPAETPAGEFFAVKWQGPENPRNFITIVRKGAPEGEFGPYAYTSRENPLNLQAPLEVGEYELRYSSASSYITLARAPIKVVPAKQAPGRVQVLSATANPIAADAVEIILDASGSMLQKIGSARRIDIAKQTLTTLTNSTIPAGTPFALRVFGREVDSCETQLDVPLSPLKPAEVGTKIKALVAKNNAKTPIGASLEKVAEDLQAAKGERLVILLTDGEETCGGDPAAAIAALRAAGIKTQISIVGFAIDDSKLTATFRRWADTGGGLYFDAKDGAALNAAMAAALKPVFELIDAQGRVVVEGIVGGEAVSVAAGRYTARLKGKTSAGQAVEVKAGADVNVRL